LEHFHFLEGMNWLEQIGIQILVIGLPLVLAVTLHEVAHGLVANRLGDPTARFLGRLTLNPLAHVDPFGTIILPLVLIFLHAGFLFGYAKPVPIVEANLRNPKKDMIFVAAAGPISNLLQAFLYMSLLHGVLSASGGSLTPGSFADQAFHLMASICKMGIEINVVLCIFNLIPLPPLDGGRVLSGLLPHEASRRLSTVEPYGVLIIMGLIILDPYLGVMSRFVWPVMGDLSSWILNLATS
jgi:Zn-dependent protease